MAAINRPLCDESSKRLEKFYNASGCSLCGISEEKIEDKIIIGVRGLSVTANLCVTNMFSARIHTLEHWLLAHAQR